MIGTKIKEERLRKKMTQETLGDLVGVSKVSVSGYEKGSKQPTLKTIYRLLEALELTPNELLGYDVQAISEDEVIHLSHNDIHIICSLKEYPELYSKISEDPKRILERISRKI